MYIHYNGNPCWKETGDCVIRAISIAAGKTWYQIYAGLCVQGRMSCGFGNFNEIWSDYLLYLGFQRHGLIFLRCSIFGGFCALFQYAGVDREKPNSIATENGDLFTEWQSDSKTS